MKSFFGFVLVAAAFLAVVSESQAARRVRVVVRQPRAAVVVRQNVVAVQAVKVRAVRVRAVKVRAAAVRVRVRVR